MPRSPLDTDWRRTAAVLFDAPDASNIYVRIEVNAEPVEAYVAETGRGRRLGFAHFVAAAAARAVAHDAPALNGYLVRGRVRARDRVTVSMTAPVPGTDGLIAVVLEDADRRPVGELAEDVVRSLRATRDRAARGRLAEYVVAGVPSAVGRGAFRVARGLARMGVPMGRFDLAPESYGAVVVTNMEPMQRGLPRDDVSGTTTFVPLLPASRNATVIAVLSPRDKVVPVGGQAIVQRRATLCFTFDHRLVDGLEVGAFTNGVVRRLLQPAALDRAPSDLAEPTPEA